MKVFLSVIEIIAAVLTTFLGPLFLYYITKYKFRKTQYLIDSSQLFEKTSEKFNKEFIEKSIEENIFHVMTGINANHKTIQYYINLKNILGQDFSWEVIKSAKSHIKFKENGTSFIQLNKVQIIWKNVSLIIALLALLGGFFLILYFSQFEIKNIGEILLIYYLAGILFMFSYFLFISVKSIIDANYIKKRLDKLKKNNFTRKRAKRKRVNQ
ncbi:hypothetical protein [Empedobacter tilapiae]